MGKAGLVVLGIAVASAILTGILGFLTAECSILGKHIRAQPFRVAAARSALVCEDVADIRGNQPVTL